MSRLFYSSLRTRLLALVFVALAPAFALIIYNGAEQIQTASTEAKNSALRLARLAGQNQEQVIDQADDLLTILSRLPHVLLDRPACHSLLTDLPQHYPHFAGFAVLTPQGEATCSSLPGVTGVNFADRRWFKESLSSRKFVASEYLVGKVTTKPSVVFALPILNNAGAVQAVIAVLEHLDWLNRFSEDAQLPPGSTFTIFDGNGTILVRHPDPGEWIGKNHPDVELVKTVLARKQEGVMDTLGHDGIGRLYAYKPLAGRDGSEAWHLAISIPKTAAYDPLWKILRPNLLWMILVTTLVSLAAWVGNRKLVLERVQSLMSATKRLAAGDLDTRTGWSRETDEIGQLGVAFDEMAESLQAHVEERGKAQQTRSQLAAIVESSSDAIIGCNLDGIVTSWNKGAEILFGYSAEEMIGHPTIDFIPPEKIENARENFARIKRGERVDSYETARIAKGGKRIQVSVTLSPVIEDSGKIIGVSSITRDVSERKGRERELKALHEINLAITSTLDLQATLQILLEKIDTLLPYAASRIRLVDKSTGNTELVACRNIDETRWNAAVQGTEGSIHRIVLSTRSPLTIRDVRENKNTPRGKIYREQGFVSYLGVPLIVKGEVIGVLSLFTTEDHDFTGEEISFAQTLAEQAGIAISNSRLYEQSRKLSEALATNEGHMRTLASGLMYAQDAEAKRIARVLHDESGQLLALVCIALDEMAKGLPDAGKERIKKIKGLLDDVEARLRDVSHELHPAMLEHLGLTPSLEFMASQTAKRAGIRFSVEAHLDERLSPYMELTFYRIIQEAFNNVVKHSRAKNVQVRLSQNEHLVRCSIEDDGDGFNPQAIPRRWQNKGEGLGLPGLRERVEALGGNLQIVSAPGAGTKLFISIPQGTSNGAQSAAC